MSRRTGEAMRFTGAAVAALCLATALVTGCAQATAGEDATPRATVLEERASPAEQPAMERWQEGAFYERPVPEIVSDLQLLGFDVTYQNHDQIQGYDLFSIGLRGTPAELPLEGSDGVVDVTLQVDDPVFREGTDGSSVEDLAEDARLSCYAFSLSCPAADASEYEALARELADGLGLGEFTSSSVEDPLGTGAMTGSFTGEGTHMGERATWSIGVICEDAETARNPEAPLLVTFSCFVAPEA